MKKKFRILVMDDDQDLLRIVRRTLELEGYDAVAASSGKSALALFEEQKPDLVILDIMMPDMDGYQVLKRIRENSSVPVIMLTAVREADSVGKSLGLGDDDYIRKPYHTHELIARVKARLRRSAREAT